MSGRERSLRSPWRVSRKNKPSRTSRRAPAGPWPPRSSNSSPGRSWKRQRRLSPLKFGVVVFPGSNCDHDTLFVLKDVLYQKTVYLWHKDRDLQAVDCVVLPGGLQYRDYLRAGAIARFSPPMEEVRELADRGGLGLR